uniref:Phage protein n=1 Tax=Strongyloides papillosus TaxID=174720 RepID=A0A0N5BZ06_STREA
MTEVKENNPTYSLEVVYQCAMPFEYYEYSRKNYSTQSSQTLVKDVEGIVITDNDVTDVDELNDVIPDKWLHITEDDTDDIEDM